MQLARELCEGISTPSDPSEAARILLTEFDEHRHLYAAVLGDSATVSSEWQVRDIIAAAWLPMLSPRMPAGVHAEFASKFLASAALACAIDWVRTENPESADSLAARIAAMMPQWAAQAAS